MITRNALRAIALATTCFAPLAAFAQAPAPAAAGTPFTGDIMIGIMGITGNNPDQAGRYNGLNTGGIDAVGEFDLRARSPWDSGNTRYYELYGNNLVFQTGNRLGSGIGNDSAWASNTSNSLINSGSVGFKVGDQGTWETAFSYDAITYTGNVIDSIYTMNGNQGSLNQPLVFGGIGGSTTNPTVAQLQAAMQPVQTGTRRNIFTAGGKYIWNDWTLTVGIRHEHKEGSLEESFDGTYGGTAFALPVDYDTDRYDVTAAYTTRLVQGQLQWTFSNFSDNNTYVTLPYAVSRTAAPLQMIAAYTTPPSNSAQYVTLMLATDAVPNTRINLNVRGGFEKQNDNFGPNTADPNYSPTSLNNINGLWLGTTDPALNAIATIWQVKISASSHPFTNADARVYYGLDSRNVSLDQYFVKGSGTGSDSSPNTSSGYYVVPQDWLKQNAGGEFGYRIFPQYNTRLTVGYRYDGIDRSNAQVGSSSTNAGSVSLSSEFGPKLDGKLSFDYASRSGSLSYVVPWNNLATGTGLGNNATYSGAYYQAPMTSEAVTFRADYTPLNSLSSDFFVQFKNENYTYPSDNGGTLAGVGQGVKQDYALVAGPDLNWRPTQNLNLHFFYTYERLYFDNTGNGACATSNTTTCAGSVGYFQNQDTTSTHTIGLSGDWKVNDKLKVKADYTFSYGTVMFGEFNGVFVATPTASYQNVTNYPDINSTMHSAKVTATYQLAPNMELVGMVAYGYFHNNDWNDEASSVQLAGGATPSILTPGYASPNYSVVAVMTGIRFKL